MRLLAYVVVTALCVGSTSSSSAQQAAGTTDPRPSDPRLRGAAPAAAPGTDPNTPAAAPSAPVTAPSVPDPIVTAPTEAAAPEVAAETSTVVPAPYPVAPAPSVIAEGAAVSDSKLERADAWVAFELERDVLTQRGERWFFPLSLALQAGFAGALAGTVDDVSTRSRVLLGATAGLSALSMLPTMLSSSRDARRAWFGIGSTAFALGLGASLVSIEDDHGKNDKDPSHGAGNWIGAAAAVQGLAMLPVGLIPGWPSENDYAAYRMLPAEARPDAAARLLLQIDRYEQKVTAWLVLSNILSAGVLGMGAIVNDDKQERQTLGYVAILPLATALLVAVPRLFVASRNERLALGQGPTRLGFNAW